MDFLKKYLKYKNKYLELKKIVQLGGGEKEDLLNRADQLRTQFYDEKDYEMKIKIAKYISLVYKQLTYFDHIYSESAKEWESSIEDLRQFIANKEAAAAQAIVNERAAAAQAAVVFAENKQRAKILNEEHKKEFKRLIDQKNINNLFNFIKHLKSSGTSDDDIRHILNPLSIISLINDSKTNNFTILQYLNSLSLKGFNYESFWISIANAYYMFDEINIPLFEFLLSNGVDINQGTKKLRPPNMLDYLLLSKLKGSSGNVDEAIKFLQAKGAKRNYTDDELLKL